MNNAAKPIRLSFTGKVITAAIIITLFIMLVRGLGNVATPFFAAIITAYLFNPIITWLHKRTSIGRGVWIGLLYLILGLLLYFAIRFIAPLIRMQYHELILNLPKFLDDLQLSLSNTPFSIGTPDPGSPGAPFRTMIDELRRQVPSQIPHLFATAFEAILLFVSYLMVTYYLLIQSDKIVEWGYELVPAQYRDEIRMLGTQIDRILSGYIRGTLLLIPIMSFITFIALSIMGVHYALVLSIFTGVVEIVPLIGPWSAAGTTIMVALFQSTTPFGWPHWLVAAVIGLIYFVLRMLEDNFVIPHIVGPAVHLHPMLVIVAILSGGAIGGAFGLFVAIPVAAVIRLMLRYFYYKLIDQDLPTQEETEHSHAELPLPDTEPPEIQGAE